MKTFLKKNICLIALVLFANLSFAYPSPKLMFKDEKPNTLVLKVTALENAIQVVMQNEKGDLLFTETLSKGYVYKKTYDIADLDNGVYYTKVVEGSNVMFFKVEKGEKNTIVEVEKLPFE